MSMAGRRLAGTQIVLILLAVGVALVIGRAFGAAAPDPTPAIGELRPAPNMQVAPAARWVDLADMVKDADAVGLIEVTNSVPVKDSQRTDSLTGLAIASGHADVEARVLSTFKGDASQLNRFAFDAFFQPGSDELAIPGVIPPLESGATYVVFIKDGRLMYPGGTYRSDPLSV